MNSDIYIYMWPDLRKPGFHAQELKFILLAQCIAIQKSYPYTTSPVAKLKWSAFLEGESVALWTYDRHIGAWGAHQLDPIDQELFPWPEWRLLDLVVWLCPSVTSYLPSNSLGVFFATSLPTPTTPPSPPLLPPTHPLVNLARNWRIQWKKSSKKAKIPARRLFKGKLCYRQ